MAFEPYGEPGGVFQGTQTLMQRASENRRAEEAARMEKEKFDILRPVMLAEQRAKLAQEGSNYVVTKQMSDFIAKAAEKWPSIVDEWNNASLIDDANERIGVRRQVLAKASGLSGVKGYSETIQAWQKQFADDALADKTADTLQNRLDVTGAQNEGKLAVKEKDLAIKEAALAAQQERFQLQQQHAKEIEQMRAESRKEVETMKGENAKAVAGSKAAAAVDKPRQQAALKVNEARLAELQTAQSDLRDFQTAVQILNDPAVRTGTGANLETAVRRFATIFDIGDPAQVKNVEQLQGLLGSSILSKARNLKGSLSDKDREALERMSPAVGKTAEGNIALLNMLIQQRQRDLKVAELVQLGRDQGDTEREIQSDVNNFLLQNPLAVPQGTPPPVAPSGLTPEQRARLEELRRKQTNP